MSGFNFLKGLDMLLVNNVNKLKKVMVFNPQKSYYKFVALIRAKDYRNGEEKPVLTNTEKQEVFVRQWLVDSNEALERCLPDMLAVTELFKCRLYMTLDRKSTVKTMMFVRNKMEECLDHFVMNANASVSVRMLNKVVPSASQSSDTSDNEKRWMFDVDTKNKDVLEVVKKLCGEDYLETFETKNGYHVVADKKFDANGRLLCLKNNGKLVRFDDSAFNEFEKKLLRESEVEVKANSLVLVAMGN